MRRFLIETGHVAGDVVALSEQEAHHALRVLRLKAGDAVILTDGLGALYEGELLQDGRVRLSALCQDREPPVGVTLYQGLPKFDKLDLICQKATEIGVTRIVPVVMERSITKIAAQDAEKKRERWVRICQEAGKQCGRARVPEVSAALPWKRALEDMSRQGLMLMPWEQAREHTLSDAKSAHPHISSIGFLVGPEGGISEREAEAARLCGARFVTLGPRILRCETAAIATAAIIMNLWGDL